MKSNHQLILVLLAIAVLIILPAAANYLVDPYHMYGPKSQELINLKRNDQYQAAGLIRSYLAEEDLGFDCVIMGNSHGQNFSPVHIETELGTGRVLKLTMPGSKPKRQSIVMERAFHEPALKRVIWLIDGYYNHESDSESITQPQAFPSDLYQDGFGVSTYIFNFDVFVQSLRDLGLFPASKFAPQGDDYGNWYVSDEWWATAVSDFHDSLRNDDKVVCLSKENHDFSLEELRLDSSRRKSPSIERLAEYARMFPGIQFEILIAPYSSLFYAASEEKKFYALFEMRRNAVESFKEIPNIRLHAFDTAAEIVTDLNRYKDMTHYDPDVNRYMIDSVANGSHVLDVNTIDAYETEWLDLLKRYQKHCLEKGPLSPFDGQ